MPIRLNDILVDFIDIAESNEDEEEDYNSKYICTLCKQEIQLEGSNDYKPKEHTLNQCLEFINLSLNGEN